MTLPRSAALLLLISLTGRAENTDWMVKTARIEGAAANIEETALTLKETAGRIAESGRIHALAELVSDANELNRRVLAAGLAADVLDKPR